MRIAVVSPNIAKESAKYLSDVLIDEGHESEYFNLHEVDKRNFTEFDKVINYGWSKNIKGKLIFNQQAAINTSRDKLETFKLLKGKVPSLYVTQDFDLAKEWIKKDKRIVVARHRIMGDNGKGIVFCETVAQLNKEKAAKFFTRYIEHTNEYRVNVYKGKVLSVYDKVVQKSGHFKFNLIKTNDAFNAFAKESYKELGLDWIGLDIIKTANGSYFFLEANSAPVLFPHTTKKLVKEFLNEDN